MPGTLIERPKMTRTMYQALKRHILSEREKVKQEQQLDEELKRQRQERALRRKKEQENTLTLEQTLEEIAKSTKKLEDAKHEKHELFSQLKNVLHQEDEIRKRVQREQTEIMNMQMVANNPMVLAHGSVRPHAHKYLMHQSLMHPSAVKRQRSPSPTGSVYGTYHTSSGVKFSNYPKPESYGKTEPYTIQPKTPYVSSSSYMPHQAAAHQVTTQASTVKYPPTQSAFLSYYPPHHKPSLSDHYSHMQRMQPAYLPQAHSTSLQQQLEHANKKPAFSEDKYKMQQTVGKMRSGPAQHHPALVGAVHTSSSQPGKASHAAPYSTRVSTSSSSQSPYTSNRNLYTSSQRYY